MSMDENSFIRQRRNLIVTSFLLAFADALNFKFAELNFLGNHVTITEPVSVAPLLWLLWAYFALRYWQVCRSDNRFTFRSAMKEVVYGVLFRSTERRARERLAEVPGVTKVPHGKNLDPLYALNELTFGLLSGHVDIGYNVEEVQPGGATVGEPKQERIHFGALDLIWARCKAFLDVTVNRPLITEVYFPFLIACAPLICLFWCPNLRSL